MKKLMLALATALPLFALADTNAVSRAEFDALKREVEALHGVECVLVNFTRGEMTNDNFRVSVLEKLRKAIVKSQVIWMENKRNETKASAPKFQSRPTPTSRRRMSSERQNTSSDQRKREVVSKEDLDAIKEELAMVRAERLKRESNAASAISCATNAPLLLRK